MTKRIRANHRALGPRPLSVAECAEFMDVPASYIRDCIHANELRAEKIQRPGVSRPLYRVHPDDFRAFLIRIKFSRIPPKEEA